MQRISSSLVREHQENMKFKKPHLSAQVHIKPTSILKENHLRLYVNIKLTSSLKIPHLRLQINIKLKSTLKEHHPPRCRLPPPHPPPHRNKCIYNDKSVSISKKRQILRGRSGTRQLKQTPIMPQTDVQEMFANQQVLQQGRPQARKALKQEMLNTSDLKVMSNTRSKEIIATDSNTAPNATANATTQSRTQPLNLE